MYAGTVVPMLEAAISVVPVEKLAVHFHDTYGQSLSNILISLQVTNREYHLHSRK
jgi:hydroxymethylglutaryl-CoA lyase